MCDYSLPILAQLTYNYAHCAISLTACTVTRAITPPSSRAVIAAPPIAIRIPNHRQIRPADREKQLLTEMFRTIVKPPRGRISPSPELRSNCNNRGLGSTHIAHHRHMGWSNFGQFVLMSRPTLDTGQYVYRAHKPGMANAML
ncbi:hypothetical protein Bbelb_232290 [Branchiostoma belcheri]|nr:hypothetical protein Bbelb_232290 [Branchiostoma belcheri]